MKGPHCRRGRSSEKKKNCNREDRNEAVHGKLRMRTPSREDGPLGPSESRQPLGDQAKKLELAPINNRFLVRVQGEQAIFRAFLRKKVIHAPGKLF